MFDFLNNRSELIQFYLERGMWTLHRGVEEINIDQNERAQAICDHNHPDGLFSKLNWFERQMEKQNEKH